MNEILEIIYEHLCKQESNRLIANENTEGISISSTEFEEIRNDVIERLKIKLKTGVCSELLIEQFARQKANLGERFGDKIEFYNVSEILNLIEKIEDDELVGNPFNKLPLKGCLHIHHNAYSAFGSSIVRNSRRNMVSSQLMELLDQRQ